MKELLWKELKFMHRNINRVLSLLLCVTLLSGILFSFAYAAGEPQPSEYEAMFPTAGTDTDVLMDIAGNLGTALEGKRIMFLGDSLLMGYGLDDYRQSWCSLLSQHYGMVITNNAIPASTFAEASRYGYVPGGCYSPIHSRELPDATFDIILVVGSGNDWFCEIPLGTDPDSRDTFTMTGAVNTLIDRLQEKYPDALLLFSTPWNSTGDKNGLGLTTADYNEALQAVCARRAIPCFSACDPALSTIDASSSAFRQEFFLTESDFWHLNAKGQKRYLAVIAQWLQDMLADNASVAGFHDVTTYDWYADAVEYAVSHGITNGTSDVTFSPYMETQRGMLLCMLYRMAGSPDVRDLSHPFEDLPENAYYYDAVVWAYHAGITTGVDATHMRPEDPLTREQLATFLFRYENAAPTGGDLGSFTDGASVSPFASDAVIWAVAEDILHGGGDGSLAPQRTATRAELVQLLTNYLINFS